MGTLAAAGLWKDLEARGLVTVVDRGIRWRLALQAESRLMKSVDKAMPSTRSGA